MYVEADSMKTKIGGAKLVFVFFLVLHCDLSLSRARKQQERTGQDAG